MTTESTSTTDAGRRDGSALERGVRPLVDGAKLAALLLDQQWHKHCEIIPDFMPKFPREDTRPTVQVRFNDGSDNPPRLRYSQGPKQGFFWDVYGEDMQTVELAVLALSQAPAPSSVGPWIWTRHERPNVGANRAAE